MLSLWHKSESLNLFHLLLLAAREIEHFLGVVQQNRALSLGLRGVDGAGEDGNFGVAGLLHDTLWRGLTSHPVAKYGLKTHLQARG